MPRFPFSGRAAPELDEQLLDTLLSGQHLPPDAPEQAHVIAEMLASLAGPAGAGELGGEQAARLAFIRAASPAGPSPAVPWPARRKPSWLPARVSGSLASALVAAAVGLGGTVAAYADALPGPIQNLAHHAIGAPPARHTRPHPPGQHHAPSVEPSARTAGHPAARRSKAARAKTHGKAAARGKQKKAHRAKAHGKAGARGKQKAARAQRLRTHKAHPGRHQPHARLHSPSATHARKG